MVRRAVITDEISPDLEAAVDLARGFGLDGVELRNLWGTRVDKLEAVELARARRIVEAAGLVVAGVAPPFFKSKLDDDDEYRAHLAILHRSIAAARALGCNLVRCFTFWRDRPVDQAWPRVLERWAEPARIGEQEGITLAIENEFDTTVGTGAQLARFLRDLGSPAVKAIWDPGNAFCDPDGETPYPDGYAAVKDQIVHVHLKDCVRTAAINQADQEGAKRHTWVALGTGEIDVRGQLAALKRDGFSGFVSLETHYRRRPLPEEVLRLPSGRTFSANFSASFSEGGAQATAECLHNWNRMLVELGSRA